VLFSGGGSYKEPAFGALEPASRQPHLSLPADHRAPFKAPSATTPASPPPYHIEGACVKKRPADRGLSAGEEKTRGERLETGTNRGPWLTPRTENDYKLKHTRPHLDESRDARPAGRPATEAL